MLSPEQQGVFNKINKHLFVEDNQSLVIDAPAGTGKTTMIKRLAKYLDQHFSHKKVIITTPTHQSLKLYCGYDKMTIQSFLGFTIELDRYGQEMMVRKTGPKKDYDILIVDEASMITKQLASEISKLNLKVLYFGDSFQLPPVGESLSVVFQLPRLTLTKNYRSDLEIIKLYRDDKNFPKEAAIPMTIEQLKELGYPILCWTNKACRFYNTQLMGRSIPIKGDKVICIKTHRKEYMIYSGQVTTWEDGMDWCYYDFCAALTVHKAQGSGFDHVLIDEPDIRKNSNTSDMMKCLYTAISRCRKSFILFKYI